MKNKVLKIANSFLGKHLIRNFFDELIKEISLSVRIVSTYDTLNELNDCFLNKKKGAYLRFGDGDIYLSTGRNDSFQEASQLLQVEMKEAFNTSGPNILKAIPIHSDLFGCDKHMFIGNHKVSDENAISFLKKSFKYFVGDKIYSPVALHYISAYDVDLAKKFLLNLKHKTNFFCGNEMASSEILEKLFGEEILHVKTPIQNAYNDIDRIENELCHYLDSISDFSVVVVAMGCSGRVLIKRILKKNYNVFLFDFGSLLDGIMGNDTRTWLKKVKIDYEELLRDL